MILVRVNNKVSISFELLNAILFFLAFVYMNLRTKYNHLLKYIIHPTLKFCQPNRVYAF